MKTKYNKFISLLNEGFLLRKENELLKFVKNYFNKYKDIEVIRHTVSNVEDIINKSSRDYNNYYQNYIKYNNYTIMRIYYRNNEYYISTQWGLYSFDDIKNIEDLSIKLNSIINIYYDQIFKDTIYVGKKLNLNTLPIFDIEKYSHLIYKILLQDKTYFKQLSDIFNNLNDEYKEKITILNNANNFDLI